MQPMTRPTLALAGSFLVAAGAALVTSARAGDPLFDSSSRSFHTGDLDISQGYKPESIRLADLDGDTDLDVAIANVGNSMAPKATVLINQADGTFAPPEFVPVGSETQDLAAGDLDGDGDVDLVFGQSNMYSQGQQLSVLLNRGDASFEPELTFPCGMGPNSIALADMDGDDDLDAITSNGYFGESDVSVLYNDGSGNLSTRVDFALGEQPSKLAAGDLSGDGFPDLAITVSGAFTRLLVVINDGTGGLGAPVAYDLSSTIYQPGPGVALADIDNDGDRDVLMSEYNSSGKVAVFTNGGTGSLTLSAHLLLPASFGSYRLAAGDVNGDGWQDILGVGLSDQHGYALIASNGAGGFLPATKASTGEMARAIELGDADGDGDLDVFVANGGSNTVTVHENEGGSFLMPAAYDVTTGAVEIDAADLDGDGDEDVLTADTGVSTFFSDGLGGFTIQAFNPGLGSQQALELVDVDLDGDPDLVLLDKLPPYEFHVLHNNGLGGWGPPASWLIGSCGPGDVAAVDYDEDGDPDLVITEYLGCPGSGSERLWLWTNTGGGSFVFHGVIGSFAITKGEQLAVGDFDEDGHKDLITTHSDWIGFWKGHGDATFDVAVLHDIGDWGPKYVTTGDFDGDGHLDVATANYGNTFAQESISVLLGTGNGSFAVPQVYFAMFSLQYGGCHGIEAVDVDLDGNVDLIAGAAYADDLVLLRSRGDGTFDPQQRYGVNGTVRYVKAVHLDGDSIPDVALSMTKASTSQPAMTFLFGLPPSAFVDLGQGLAGAGGIPTLAGEGALQPGSSVTLSLTGAMANAPATLVVGLSQLVAPFKGGVLVPSPHLLLGGFVTGAGGDLVLSATWPAGVPSATAILFQYWITDAAGPQGFAASNGLQGLTP